MDFEISDTNKGKKSLIYDGFICKINVFCLMDYVVYMFYHIKRN